MRILGYASVIEVRNLTGLTTNDIENTELEDLIDLATKMIIEELTIAVINEELSGNINGTNTTFSVAHYPIADTNGDMQVTGSDVTVYAWTDEDDPSTKSSVSVDQVFPLDGIVVLENPPSTNIKKLTIDYAYTLEESINWDLVKLACSWLTAYLFCIKKFTTVPESVVRGPIRFRYYTKPYNEYLNNYYRIMSLIKSKNHIKKEHSSMTLVRSLP